MYHRVVGSTLAVPVRGHGSPGFPIFLLPETGNDLEACLRERERESGREAKLRVPSHSIGSRLWNVAATVPGRRFCVTRITELHALVRLKATEAEK